MQEMDPDDDGAVVDSRMAGRLRVARAAACPALKDEHVADVGLTRIGVGGHVDVAPSDLVGQTDERGDRVLHVLRHGIVTPHHECLPACRQRRVDRRPRRGAKPQVARDVDPVFFRVPRRVHQAHDVAFHLLIDEHRVELGEFLLQLGDCGHPLARSLPAHPEAAAALPGGRFATLTHSPVLLSSQGHCSPRPVAALSDERRFFSRQRARRSVL